MKKKELPEELKGTLQKAKKLEWVTIIYMSTVVVLMYLVMGSSQAMKTAWLEDILSLIPTIAFLIAEKINTKGPNNTFPYGYHRVFSIAFLTGSLALFSMGLFLILDSSMSLLNMEHPTIGIMPLFGYDIWQGWVMIAVLIYSFIPAIYIGFKKLPLAKKLHNKILFTDSEAQKADYNTSFAAILGIIGIGYGLWWADAAAAIFISFSILKDGYDNLKTAVLDLMDRHPVHTENHKKDDLVLDIENFVKSWDWVKDARVRFREHGQVYFGEIAVVVHTNENLAENIEQGIKSLTEFHWKINDVTITPLPSLPKDY
ncbi:MAG: cation diffusion facilitator family transporter [Balneolaceae bacterium]